MGGEGEEGGERRVRVLTHGRCLSSHFHAEFRIFQWLPIQHDRLDLGTAGSSVWYAPLSLSQDRSGCHQSAMSFVLNKIDLSGSPIACLPFNGKPPPGRRARRWPRRGGGSRGARCRQYPHCPSRRHHRTGSSCRSPTGRSNSACSASSLVPCSPH